MLIKYHTIETVEAKAAGRKERYPNSAGKSWLPFLLPALDPNAIKKAMKFKSPLLPASTYLITEKSNECWMPDGNYGVCGPALSCNNPPSGMLPSRNTCRYVSNGKEVRQNFLISIIVSNLRIQVG